MNVAAADLSTDKKKIKIILEDNEGDEINIILDVREARNLAQTILLELRSRHNAR